jgi:hypothetical protein
MSLVKGVAMILVLTFTRWLDLSFDFRALSSGVRSFFRLAAVPGMAVF